MYYDMDVTHYKLGETQHRLRTEMRRITKIKTCHTLKTTGLDNAEELTR